MKCVCKDWEENIGKLNAGHVMMSVHGMSGYTGKTFVYCPWCRRELVSDDSVPGVKSISKDIQPNDIVLVKCHVEEVRCCSDGFTRYKVKPYYFPEQGEKMVVTPPGIELVQTSKQK